MYLIFSYLTSIVILLLDDNKRLKVNYQCLSLWCKILERTATPPYIFMHQSKLIATDHGIYGLCVLRSRDLPILGRFLAASLKPPGAFRSRNRCPNHQNAKDKSEYRGKNCPIVGFFSAITVLLQSWNRCPNHLDGNDKRECRKENCHIVGCFSAITLLLHSLNRCPKSPRCQQQIRMHVTVIHSHAYSFY